MVAALVPSLALAQFVPQSGDLQANTYATGNQRQTVVAVDPNSGTFVVAWDSNAQDGSFAAEQLHLGDTVAKRESSEPRRAEPQLGVIPSSGSRYTFC